MVNFHTNHSNSAACHRRPVGSAPAEPSMPTDPTMPGNSGSPSGSPGVGGTQGMGLADLLMQIVGLIDMIQQMLSGGSPGTDTYQTSDPLGLNLLTVRPLSGSAFPTAYPVPEAESPSMPPSSGGSQTPFHYSRAVLPGRDARSPQVRKAIQDIGNDPEGRILLAEAEKKGITIKLDPPEASKGGSIRRGYQENNTIVILSYPNTDELRSTIAHELVHAVTQSDNNSMMEETVADVIGDRIGRRSAGKASTAAQEIRDFKQRKAWVYDPTSLYPQSGLAADNNILRDLQKMGINVDNLLNIA